MLAGAVCCHADMATTAATAADLPPCAAAWEWYRTTSGGGPCVCKVGMFSCTGEEVASDACLLPAVSCHHLTSSMALRASASTPPASCDKLLLRRDSTTALSCAAAAQEHMTGGVGDGWQMSVHQHHPCHMQCNMSTTPPVLSTPGCEHRLLSGAVLVLLTCAAWGSTEAR